MEWRKTWGTTDWWTVLRSKWRCFAGGFLPRWPCVLGLLCYSLIWYSCLWPDLDHICKFQFLSWKKEGETYIFLHLTQQFLLNMELCQHKTNTGGSEKKNLWKNRQHGYLEKSHDFSIGKSIPPKNWHVPSKIVFGRVLSFWHGRPLFRCIFKLQPLNSPIRAIDHVIQLMYQKQFFCHLTFQWSTEISYYVNVNRVGRIGLYPPWN